MWGAKPPHFGMVSQAPGAGQTSKTRPPKIRPDCLQVPRHTMAAPINWAEPNDGHGLREIEDFGNRQNSRAKEAVESKWRRSTLTIV